MMAENKAQNKVEVKVSDPVTEGEGRTKHTLYLVERFGKDASSVRRRYSDFQWLYGKLLDEVPGCILPIFEHKQALRESIRFSEVLIEDRCIALDSFLKRVVAHPELQDCACLKLFLTAFNEEWETARNRKADEKQGDGSYLPPSGVRGFFQNAKKNVLLATGSELEKTPDDSTFEQFEDYITLMDQHVKGMAKDSLVGSKASKEHGTVLANLAASFSKLGETRFPTAYNDDLGYFFSELSDETSRVSNTTIQFQLQEDKIWVQPMQELSREVDAAKLALDVRKNLLWKYSRQIVKQKQKEAAFEKGKVTQEDVDTTKSESQEMWKTVEIVSKRVQRELDVFRIIFEEKLRAALAAYSKLQTEFQTEMLKGWSAIQPIATGKAVEPPTEAFQKPPPYTAPPAEAEPPLVTEENGEAPPEDAKTESV